MEKETKKKNTTGTKKTTSAKKGTTTKKTTSASKTAAKPSTTVKKSTTTKKSTKKDEKVVKDTTKKANTKTIPVKKVEIETKKDNTVRELKKTDKKVEVKPTTKKTKEVEKEIKETTLGEELKAFIKSDIGSLIGIIIIIVIIMGAFFFVTDFIKNLNEEEKDLVVSQDIQYDEIILSNLLKQPNSAYYVLIYDKGTEAVEINDIDVQTYQIYLDVYSTLDNSLRIYSADLNKKFNEAYVTKENSNLLVSNVEELKVKSTTLVRVENGTVVAAFDTRDSIIEHLTALVG